MGIADEELAYVTSVGRKWSEHVMGPVEYKKNKPHFCFISQVPDPSEK
jgi:hypothetical protein